MILKMVSITRLLIKLSILFICVGSFALAHADGIRVKRAQAVLGMQGQLLVNSRFETSLPASLHDALKQGVALDFQLQYQLIAPRVLAYNLRFNPWADTVSPISYKLTYHPLTDKYRVTIGTFSTEYSNLQIALRSIGGIVKWDVHPVNTFLVAEKDQIYAQIRLSLSSHQLPRPFQINTLTSKAWGLDSGWVRLRVETE